MHRLIMTASVHRKLARCQRSPHLFKGLCRICLRSRHRRRLNSESASMPASCSDCLSDVRVLSKRQKCARRNRRIIGNRTRDVPRSGQTGRQVISSREFGIFAFLGRNVVFAGFSLRKIQARTLSGWSNNCGISFASAV